MSDNLTVVSLSGSLMLNLQYSQVKHSPIFRQPHGAVKTQPNVLSCDRPEVQAMGRAPEE